MVDPHAVAVELAIQATERLAALFAAVGGIEHPHGAVWAAYRIGRQALGARFTVGHLRDVQQSVYAAVQGAARNLVPEAVAQGAQLARMQLDTYSANASLNTYGPLIRNELAEIEDAALEAVLGQVAQANRQIVLSYVATSDAALIVGDGSHVGMFSPALAAELLTRWLTTSHQAAFAATVAGSGRADQFQRQAVATLNGRTTNCCLRVHGQIVGMDAPFRLDGTPRYADQLRYPPFHRSCRTVTALVPAGQGEDEITMQMRAGAQAELEARARGATTQRRRSGTALEP